MKASFKTHSDQIYFTHAFTTTCCTHLSQSKSKVHLSNTDSDNYGFYNPL